MNYLTVLAFLLVLLPTFEGTEYRIYVVNDAAGQEIQVSFKDRSNTILHKSKFFGYERFIHYQVPDNYENENVSFVVSKVVNKNQAIAFGELPAYDPSRAKKEFTKFENGRYEYWYYWNGRCVDMDIYDQTQDPRNYYDHKNLGNKFAGCHGL